LSENHNHIIDELLVKYLLEEANAAEQKQVEQWIEADPANKKYFNGFRLVWEQSKKLAAVSPVDEDAAWKRFQKRIGETKPVLRSMDRYRWLRIAALLVLFAGAGLIVYRFLNSGGPLPMHMARTTTNVLRDTLPDGSVVTLNKNSSISYPDRFKGDSRTVTLQGEAFFQVTPNKKKPFLITVNDVTIKVVGTSFNVRSEKGSTEVIVETGIVQVIKNNKMVELKPKEKIMVRPQDSVLTKTTEEDRLYNYYRTKEFICDNTPLWKLIEVLSEAYQVDIVLSRPGLRNLQLTTTFNNESLDRILEIISETFNLQVVKTKNGIIIK
jgi:transmembrane sensor